jgi:hypothetical protein
LRCPSNPALERSATEELDRLIADAMRLHQKRFNFRLATEIVPVHGEGLDAEGVPYYVVFRSRVHGAVHISGQRAKVFFPVMPDGTFHQPTLRHELLHLLLRSEGITGHPPEYRNLAFRWRSLPGAPCGLASTTRDE